MTTLSLLFLLFASEFTALTFIAILVLLLSDSELADLNFSS